MLFFVVQQFPFAKALRLIVHSYEKLIFDLQLLNG